MLARPAVGWPPLQGSAVFRALTVVATGGGGPGNGDPLVVQVQTAGQGVDEDDAECFQCNGLRSLPLAGGALDCVLLTAEEPAQATAVLADLGPYFQSAPHVLVLVMLPGQVTVDTLVELEAAAGASPRDMEVVTLRQLTPGNQWQCGARVLDAARSVLLPAAAPRGSSFAVIQLQRPVPPPNEEEETAPEPRARLLRLLNTSLYLDHHQPGILSRTARACPDELCAEELEYLHPPAPSSCSLHLPNYHDDWRALYPGLRVLLEDFDAIQAEALAVSQWTPWPEYHFRDGGTENDWRVVPFLHTFPAMDPTQSKWIPSTCARCPAIVRALEKLKPLVRTALLSRLGPDTRLSAHTGWEDLANFVLRVHLTLATPPPGADGIELCGTWVEGEIRSHRTRDFIVFDDSKVHKAFNLHPTDSRVVLILDLVRPDYVPSGVAVGGHTEDLDQFIAAFT